MTSHDSPVTIRDVARAAGVGTATASRALNGVPMGPRGREAAARVVRIAEELGYVPNHAARALRGRRSSIIVLADDPSNATTGAAIDAMDGVAGERGDFFVSAIAVGSTPEAQFDTIRLACSLRPLAIVVSSTRLSEPALAYRVGEILGDYRATGGRVVVVGSLPIPADTVSMANLDAGITVGRHAAALGRERFGILAGTSGQPVFDDRVEGFLRALDEIGIPRRAIAIEHSSHSRDGGAEAMERLLARPERPEVVLAANDLLAYGALTSLHAAGLSVPDDVALTGIDDEPMTRDVTPPLTSYAFPFDEVGRRIAALALKEQGEPTERVSISGTLVARASTAV